MLADYTRDLNGSSAGSLTHGFGSKTSPAAQHTLFDTHVWHG